MSPGTRCTVMSAQYLDFETTERILIPHETHGAQEKEFLSVNRRDR